MGVSPGKQVNHCQESLVCHSWSLHWEDTGNYPGTHSTPRRLVRLGTCEYHQIPAKQRIFSQASASCYSIKKQEWKPCVQFMLVRATCCFLPPARTTTCIPTDTDCEILTHVRGLPQRVRIVDLRKDQHLFHKKCHVRPLCDDSFKGIVSHYDIHTRPRVAILL